MNQYDDLPMNQYDDLPMNQYDDLPMNQYDDLLMNQNDDRHGINAILSWQFWCKNANLSQLLT